MKFRTWVICLMLLATVSCNSGLNNCIVKSINDGGKYTYPIDIHFAVGDTVKTIYGTVVVLKILK